MTLLYPLLPISSHRLDASVSVVKEKTNGGSAVTAFSGSESAFASAAAVFETLRVLYLCAFLSFPLNLVLTVYLVWCLLVVGVALHGGTTLLFLGTGSHMLFCLLQKGDEAELSEDSLRSASRLRAEESTKNPASRSSEISPRALSWIAMAMQRCFTNS